MNRIVAIVGRPNVGKSTLFNRLTGERKAIVDDVSGVTRDRHYGTSDWNGINFTVIDTGGFVPDSSDVFEAAIREQVHIAIEEAAVLLFVVDVTTDVNPLDEEFASVLRKSKKPVLLVVNKVDNDRLSQDSPVFYSLGFPEYFEISAITGSGTGELLDKLVPLLEPAKPDLQKEEEKDLPRIAIVGRPNVGKSSLINALTGADRNIVTPVAGTTRDSIDTRYTAFGRDLVLVDTAGIRRKSKVSENIEFYSVMRSLRALEDSDVVVLVLDATLGMEAQDLNLFWMAHRQGKGVVILVNKWDLVTKDSNTHLEYTRMIHERISPFTDVPILYISATEKQRIYQATETIVKVYEGLTLRIPTHELNEYLLPLIEAFPPPSRKGKFVKIKYVTQLPSRRVAFALFCNLPQYVAESYTRFLENKLRDRYPLTGVPVTLFFRKK
ncbi:MAG: ribosome biogenesis GTPase Der [Bacteroidetes bacterium]|nr:ribosome biogenesis GTPase Der [Bacteroidota bacterium]